MKRIAGTLVALAVVAAGCGSSSSGSGSSSPSTSTPTTSPTSSGGVTISTKSIPGLGTVLVNAQGDTLYMFAPDKQTRVTCLSTCAAIWPPVHIATGAKAVAAGQAKDIAARQRPRHDGRASRHLRRLAALHLHRRHRTRQGHRTRPEPERRPLVHAHAGGEGG